MSWTKTPPTEVGLYFARRGGPDGPVEVMERALKDSREDAGIEWSMMGTDVFVGTRELVEDGVEWWSEPIAPPEGK